MAQSEEEELDFITTIGLTAAAMGGVSLFPQLLKVLKTKSTKDISRETILMLAGSTFLWLVYRILLKNITITIANFFGFIQAIIILFFKIKNQIKSTRGAVNQPSRLEGFFMNASFSPSGAGQSLRGLAVGALDKCYKL